MKDKWTLALVTMLALSTGALGTALLQSESAEAQAAERQWTECFLADFDGHADGNNMGQMRRGRGNIRLAPGWTPVGGLAAPMGRYVVLCR